MNMEYVFPIGKERKRKRDVGAGRPFRLKLRERFLMLLVYYRLTLPLHYRGFFLILTRAMFVGIYAC
jgi:hypothetical protein